MSEWTPIGHRAPLPRIENAKPTPPEPDPVEPHIRLQLDHVERMNRLKVGERIWQHVVASATGTLPPTSQPVVHPIEPLYGVSPAIKQMEDMRKRLYEAMGAGDATATGMIDLIFED